MQGNLLTLVPEVRTVLSRLRRELLEPVIALDNNTKTSETQTTTPEPPRVRNIPEPDILPNSTPDVLRVQPRFVIFFTIDSQQLKISSVHADFSDLFSFTDESILWRTLDAVT